MSASCTNIDTSFGCSKKKLQFFVLKSNQIWSAPVISIYNFRNILQLQKNNIISTTLSGFGTLPHLVSLSSL
jgi:hypothetical protein